jgi:threonylcarbamoyladenosine tRNA methylthiotransferase MtaB
VATIMQTRPSKPTFRVRTLGCRVNHAESRELESLLLERGLKPVSDGTIADLEVVHTCAVTSQAAAKSRHAIRRAKQGDGTRLPHVLVTGCLVSADRTTAAEIAGGTDQVSGHREPDQQMMMQRVAQQVDTWLSKAQISRDRVSHLAITVSPPAPVARSKHLHALPLLHPPTHTGRHIRSEIRIQDGCDAHCTFCIIPTLRPTLRSKSTVDVVEEATRLVDLGHREIVLSGIFMGAYGHETALRRKQNDREQEALAELLDAVAQVPGLVRLRLSSLEPGDVTQPLLDAMVANRPIVVPHLHLPLQSGSNAILRRMNRQYTIEEYLQMVESANAALTDDTGLPPAITTDIICGFPGETEDDFLQTYQCAKHVGYMHMHVFPFSPRSGTAAARWTDRFVPTATIKQRVRALIELEEDPADGLAMQWRRRFIGRTLRVLLEQPSDDAPDIMTGRCDHYDLVHVSTDKPRGSIVRVKITHACPTHVAGHHIDLAQPLPILAALEHST